MPNTLLEITSPHIIHCGQGAFERIPAEATRLGSRAVIVTGRRLHGSEQIAELVRNLESRGAAAHIADPVTAEPTVDMVDELAGFLRSKQADVVIAIGGGSVMDCAKAAAVMAVNEGSTEDYQLRRREITNPPLAQIFAPTTAGTGSEATRVSVLTNPRIGVKRSISHPLMTPDVVMLDPDLTVSCPLYLTTTTAMDAFSHAIESAVSTKATAYTRHTALAAIEKLGAGLPRCQADPSDTDARLDCLLGACLAGLAMQQGMGASHSLAPALCIFTGMRHSEAIAVLLPHSIRLNIESVPAVYDEVKRALGTDDIAGRLEELCSTGGFACSLARFGVKESDWPAVREIMSRYASHRQTNPVEVTNDYAEKLFLRAVRG
ncbi:MAG: iron-containing alcohol dehydrogenase [Armatimonadota bacterium]|nr:iron-containing alcohol dehydrogenase [Armatimonadota bacterium]